MRLAFAAIDSREKFEKLCSQLARFALYASLTGLGASPRIRGWPLLRATT